MLPSNNRLKKARDIARVFKQGRYTVEGPVVLRTIRNGSDASRAVVVVGKKVSKKAVIRNRIRRRIIGELNSRWATVAPGYDIVITVRDDISAEPADRVSGTVERALERSGLASRR